MTYAVDIDKELRYVLEEDRELPDGDAGKPVFLIKGLSAEEAALIDDELAVTGREGKGRKRKKQQEMKWRIGSSIIKILDAGLLGWQNFRTKDGKEIPWDETKRKRNYNYLPEAARAEIADAIRNISDVSEEERENLDLEQPS
jgi:hypothetical protein